MAIVELFLCVIDWCAHKLCNYLVGRLLSFPTLHISVNSSIALSVTPWFHLWLFLLFYLDFSCGYWALFSFWMLSLNVHLKLIINLVCESLQFKLTENKMAKTISLYGFPSVENPEDIKEFLEEYTGEGTVLAVEVALPKSSGSRTHANVQFTDVEAAETIKSLAEDYLWYENSYLKARDARHDIVPMPRNFVQCIDNITLNFGCQISKEIFSLLWKQENVSVKFGFGLRKFFFFFSFLSTDYKLELSYENIWQIDVRRPHGGAKKFLIIQVCQFNFLDLIRHSNLSKIQWCLYPLTVIWCSQDL